MTRWNPPEMNLEPPEINMEEPSFCKDCQEEECLLDLKKECPEWEKADQITHAEWLEVVKDETAFEQDFEDFLEGLESEQEPSEDEMELTRRMCIMWTDDSLLEWTNVKEQKEEL